MSIGERVFPFVNDWALGERVEGLRGEVVRGAKGRVLEIGAGTGLNFRHYREVEGVTAVEPAAGMRRRAEMRAGGASAKIEVIEGKAGELPIEDASVDTVILTFVLCSIRDLSGALGEIRRVLRPGGELRILEHVRSERAGMARVQRAVEPVWKKAFAGCSLLVDPRGEIERAGFDVGGIQAVMLPLLPPIREGAMGVALRR